MKKKPIDKNEIGIIKSYGTTDKMKLTICKKYAGDHTNHSLDAVIKNAKGTVNTEKLACNLSRAKNNVFEYAMCNPWDFFATFTIDEKKHPRNDLKLFFKKFSQWLRDYNKKHNLRIKYVIIPELHKDQINWHMHAIMIGIPLSHLKKFEKGDKTDTGKSIKKSLWEKGYSYWPAYTEKFGFNSFGVIKNHEATAKYITKYITKDLESSVNELNAKTYYCSTKLKKATEVRRGYLAIPVLDSQCDFSNDFVKIIDFKRETLPYILDNIIPLEN